MTTTPAEAQAELLAQHDSLRSIMDLCEALADEIEHIADGDPIPLTRELARLRLAFNAHNAYEEQHLKPVLVAQSSFGPIRIDRMVADHVKDHRTIETHLSSTIVGGARQVIKTLRAHLEAEERYFVTARALRRDAISRSG